MLHESGKKPTSSRVSSLLTKPGVLLSKHARGALQQVQRELGYEKRGASPIGTTHRFAQSENPNAQNGSITFRKGIVSIRATKTQSYDSTHSKGF